MEFQEFYLAPSASTCYLYRNAAKDFGMVIKLIERNECLTLELARKKLLHCTKK